METLSHRKTWMFRWSSRSLLNLILVSIFLHNEVFQSQTMAEIKFIPVNRQVRNIPSGSAGGNLIDKSEEPMALESKIGPQVQMPLQLPMVVPTFRLTQDKNGSILEEVPSMQGTPVLKFLTVSQTQSESVEKGERKVEAERGGNVNEEEEEDDDNAEESSDEEDDSEEEGEKGPKAEDSSEIAALNLNMLTRHRRRLMQMRNKILENIDMKPNGEYNENGNGGQNVISSLPSTSAEVVGKEPILTKNETEGEETTLRPPPDRIIYALPEQSFWTPEGKRFVKPKKKRNRNRNKSKKSKNKGKTGNKEIPLPQELAEPEEVEIDPFLPPSPSAKGPNLAVPLQSGIENDTEEYEDEDETTTPLALPLSGPAANMSDNVTATSTESSRVVAPPIPTPTPASSSSLPGKEESISFLNRMRGLEEENKERIKAEKKFHLGQCMRYCMDAIL